MKRAAAVPAFRQGVGEFWQIVALARRGLPRGSRLQ